MSDTVQQLEQALKEQPLNPLRNHQVEEYQSEAKRLKDIVQAPAFVTGVDRGAAAKRSREVEQHIQKYAAKPLQGAEKDKVAKLAAEVMQDVIRPALLPHEEMRRNPAGAVGRFMKQENSPSTQHAIQQWKRAQLAVESDNPDPDLANVERFRPEKMIRDGASTFMAGAQIPGNFAMTPAAKANWPLGEPTATTAIGEVKKREMSEAQKAGLQKAQAARAAKRAEKVG